MTSTKQAFGRFVIAKRQAVGLTQHELAERLFVTDSAVSKWERGLSYPDITIVAALARELGVSEGELINASDDAASRDLARDALGYRRWKAAIFWTTAIAYAVALFTCFIVNLAVQHTLSWFWVVLPALAIAFSLTTLPLLRVVRVKGWTTLAAFLLSLFALLFVVWLQTGLGGWLAIPIASVLFAAVLIFGAIWLAGLQIPEPAARHRAAMALGLDTIALLVLLLVCLLVAGQPLAWVTQALPIAAICLVLPWGTLVAVRYLPISGLYRAAVTIGFVALYGCLVLGRAIDAVAHHPESRPVDFSQWHDGYIDGNVTTIVLVGSLIVAAILAIAAALRRPSAAERRSA